MGTITSDESRAGGAGTAAQRRPMYGTERLRRRGLHLARPYEFAAEGADQRRRAGAPHIVVAGPRGEAQHHAPSCAGRGCRVNRRPRAPAPPPRTCWRHGPDGVLLSPGTGRPDAARSGSSETSRGAGSGALPADGDLPRAPGARPPLRGLHLQAEVRAPRREPPGDRQASGPGASTSPRRTTATPSTATELEAADGGGAGAPQRRHGRRPACTASCRMFTIQYHSEASPGPHDTEFLFDRFLAERARGRGAARWPGRSRARGGRVMPPISRRGAPGRRRDRRDHRRDPDRGATAGRLRGARSDAAGGARGVARRLRRGSAGATFVIEDAGAAASPSARSIEPPPRAPRRTARLGAWVRADPAAQAAIGTVLAEEALAFTREQRLPGASAARLPERTTNRRSPTSHRIGALVPLANPGAQLRAPPLPGGIIVSDADQPPDTSHYAEEEEAG